MKTIYEIVDKDQLKVKSSLKRILSFLDELDLSDSVKNNFRKIILDEVNSLYRELRNGV